ncbi:MAG TPA: hypothetical protein VMW25_03085 [Clostridia bacterium]|nr:hypothetical protein [Clostridia bacterium]
MSELPRMFLLFFFSLFFKVEFLRFFYFSACLLSGVVGVFFFLKNLVFQKETLGVNLSSFFGALFYILNLGTLQHFYVPLEMFGTMYAFLPWLLLFSARYIANGEKKFLGGFFLITLSALPMAYAATLWYVYFVCLSLFSLSLAVLKLGKFRRVFIVLGLTLLVNSFWLLPNLYLLVSSARNVGESKINLLFSEKAFLMDLKYANLKDTLLLKGFLFDWREYQDGMFLDLMRFWSAHLKNQMILFLGYLLSGLAILGVAVSVVRRRKECLVLLGPFLLGLIFLLHGLPGLKEGFEIVRQNLSLFKEGLRFPWTKFSLIVIFGFSVFFGEAVNFLLEFIKPRVGKFGLSISLLTVLILWMLPVFKGNLISNSRQVEIPQDYFETFSWFRNKPESERVGILPASSFWGWEYYDWGFEGAGFIWFGLKQPVLVRDFDRWSVGNENYYWEISNAIYSKKSELLIRVLEKYQVKWLLVDGHITNPAWQESLYLEELEEMVKGSDRFRLAQTFGKIKIYEVSLKAPVDEFVFLAQGLPAVGPNYSWNNFDQAYWEQGNYKEGESPDVYFPFRSLFTGRSPEELDFEISETEAGYIFSQELPETLADYELVLPESDDKELVWINPDNLADYRYLTPKVGREGNVIEVFIPKVGGYFGVEIDPREENLLTARNCNRFSQGTINNELWDRFLRLRATDAYNCSAAFSQEHLLHKFGYLIKVEAQNIKGKSLLFWIENLTGKRADMELYLPKDENIHYLIQPPMSQAGLGYTLHLDNISIGRQTSINDLGEITINPIPYNFLTKISLVPKENKQKETKLLSVKTNHPNPSLYEVELDKVPENSTLVLSQSFHPGWKAYLLDAKRFPLDAFLAPLLGKELKEHVLVNNWENGWRLTRLEDCSLSSSNLIILVFWPQYLEYLGFGILGLGTIIILPVSLTKALRS